MPGGSTSNADDPLGTFIPEYGSARQHQQLEEQQHIPEAELGQQQQHEFAKSNLQSMDQQQKAEPALDAEHGENKYKRQSICVYICAHNVYSAYISYIYNTPPLRRLFPDFDEP